VGEKSTKISEVEALYALEKTQFQAIVKGHISEIKELQDTVVRLQTTLDKVDKPLPAVSVKGGDPSAAASLHMSTMITDKMTRILNLQSNMQTSLSTIATQQEKLQLELESARNDAIQAVAYKKEVELHVAKLLDTIGGLRSTLVRKEVHIGDLTKRATLGELHLDRSRKENAEMVGRCEGMLMWLCIIVFVKSVALCSIGAFQANQCPRPLAY
jgi:chromosome segregation ATPase